MRTAGGRGLDTSDGTAQLKKSGFSWLGQGQVWRKQGKREQVLDVGQGVSLTIPLGTLFQFRNTGSAPLEFLIIATTPPWPGEDEAVVVREGRWEPTVF